MAQGNTAIFVTHDTEPTTSKKVGRKPKNIAARNTPEVLTQACPSNASTTTTEATKRKLQKSLEVKVREEEVEVEEEEDKKKKKVMNTTMKMTKKNMCLLKKLKMLT
jgi:hypothetical protein